MHEEDVVEAVRRMTDAGADEVNLADDEIVVADDEVLVADDEIVVADDVATAIFLVNGVSTFLTNDGIYSGPYGMAFDLNGNIMVYWTGSYPNRALGVYDKQGKLKEPLELYLKSQKIYYNKPDKYGQCLDQLNPDDKIRLYYNDKSKEEITKSCRNRKRKRLCEVGVQVSPRRLVRHSGNHEKA